MNLVAKRAIGRYFCSTRSLLMSEMESNSIVQNFNDVKLKISNAATATGKRPEDVRLVAVSKTKPAESIQVLYDQGHRHFGENYMQELLDKAAGLPRDVEWHFIGHLQSSKASKLVREIPNLAVVESVDRLNLAQKLEAACIVAGRESLPVYIQVKTSDEDSKSGVPMGDLITLADDIQSHCPHLTIQGLMTIGAASDGESSFTKLVQCREELVATEKFSDTDLQLSMGMSGDFERAIAGGATSVRVGSLLFGARIYADGR